MDAANASEAGETLDPSGDGRPDRPDARTLGPYRLLGEIGRGGMGIVYRAHHEALDRTVALKVLLAGEGGAEEALVRFRREASAVARLGHHPNIVPVYDVGEAPVTGPTGEERAHYIAMHLVEGESLDRVLDRGPLDPRTAIDVARRLARALAHAHAHGILHRDVKPANILLAGAAGISDSRRRSSESAAESDPESETSSPKPQPVPMLTDFGLARDVSAESRVTRSGTALGTPHYMPPEQADGDLEAVDERSDVYSLGAALYEMLTGRPPFEGATVYEVIREVMVRPAPGLRGANPAVSRDLETICLKCLEKDPARRYPSASALAADLDRALEGRPIEERRISRAARWWRSARRNKAATLALASGAGVILCAAAAVAIWSRLSTVRGQKADEAVARAEAEARERETARLRDKSQTINRVLLKAHADLGSAHAELRRIARAEGATAGDLERVFARHEAAIEEFVAGAGGDPAAQATALAVQGWLLRLGGREDAAAKALARARATDPEGPWAAVFESMALLSEYFSGIEKPTLRVGQADMWVDPVAGEDAARRALRARFEEARGRIPTEVWGGRAAKEFLEATKALAAVRLDDPRAAEDILTRLLAVSELVWLRDEFLVARSQVRLLLGDLDRGTSDARRVLDEQPDHRVARMLVAQLLTARALRVVREGGDFEGAFAEAAAFGRSWVEARPDSPHARSALGFALVMWGLAGARAEDPRPRLREAADAYEEALRIDPDSVIDRFNVAASLAEWAEEEEDRGQDPSRELERVLEECAEVARRMPDHPGVGMVRARATMILARRRESSGGDPADLLESVVAEATGALERNPGDPEWLLTRGIARTDQGTSRAARGRDPSEAFRAAIADFGAIPEGHALRGRALGNSGACWFGLGQFAEKTGGDGVESLGRALACFEGALGLDPGNPSMIANRGNAHLKLGEARATPEGRRRAHLERALAEYEEALRLQPGQWVAARGTLMALVTLAKVSMIGGEDPGAILDRLERDATALAAALPNTELPLLLRAEGRRLCAVQALRSGEDPRAAFLAAAEDTMRSAALGRRPESAATQAVALLQTVAAEDRKRGGDPRPSLKRALDFLAEEGERRQGSERFYGVWGDCLIEYADTRMTEGEDGLADYEEAVRLYDRALALAPSFWQARANRGAALLNLGRFAQAARDLRAGLEGKGAPDAVIAERAGEAERYASEPEWSRSLRRGLRAVSRGHYAFARKAIEEGLEAVREAGAWEAPELREILAAAHYNLACAEALASAGIPGPRAVTRRPPDEAEASRLRRSAVERLRQAFAHGWSDVAKIASDRDLDPIREDAGFRALMEERGRGGGR